MRLLRWVGLVGFGVGLGFTGCVGDTAAPPDSGNDATTSDASSDVASQDASDAGDAAPSCNLSAPFGGKTGFVPAVDQPGALQTSFYPIPSGLLAYFARDIPDSGQGFDIYTVDRQSKAQLWQNSTRLDAVDNDAGNDDFNPVPSSDLTELFFARSPGANIANVWESVVTDAGYGAPGKVNQIVNNVGNRVEPTWIDPTSARLYLSVINTADAGAQYDMFIALRSGPGQPFTGVTKMGALDTASNEKNAVLTGDELTVYFASDRAGGMGGYDVYTATRAAITDPFGTPTAVTELNTTGDDIPVFVALNGCSIILTDGTSLGTYIKP